MAETLSDWADLVVVALEEFESDLRDEARAMTHGSTDSASRWCPGAGDCLKCQMLVRADQLADLVVDRRRH